MAKLRTKEQLADKVAAERAWRIKEITYLQSTLLSSKSLNTQQAAVLRRSGVAILYAHWEGFVKVSSSAYLEFVAMQNLKTGELKENFVAICYKSILDQVGTTKKFSVFDDMMASLIGITDKAIRVPYKGIIHTSNLSSSILREIMWCIGLNYNLFETKEKKIDVSLLGRRNHIAHGDDVPIEPEDFAVLATDVIDLISTYNNELLNTLYTEGYRRQKTA